MKHAVVLALVASACASTPEPKPYADGNLDDIALRASKDGCVSGEHGDGWQRFICETPALDQFRPALDSKVRVTVLARELDDGTRLEVANAEWSVPHYDRGYVQRNGNPLNVDVIMIPTDKVDWVRCPQGSCAKTIDRLLFRLQRGETAPPREIDPVDL
jgi:hypothetical protein